MTRSNRSAWPGRRRPVSPIRQPRSARFTVSQALTVEFGRFYDAQVFHTDPEAARKTVYGGLIASGLQTIAFTFKLFVDRAGSFAFRTRR